MTCLRMSSSVCTGHSSVEILELCDSGGHVVLGCVGVLVEALCVHPLHLESNLMILSESSDRLGYPILQKRLRLVKLL